MITLIPTCCVSLLWSTKYEWYAGKIKEEMTLCDRKSIKDPGTIFGVHHDYYIYWPSFTVKSENVVKKELNSFFMNCTQA